MICVINMSQNNFVAYSIVEFVIAFLCIGNIIQLSRKKETSKIRLCQNW